MRQEYMQYLYLKNGLTGNNYLYTLLDTFNDMEQKIIDWFELNWAKVFVSKPDNYTVDIDKRRFCFYTWKMARWYRRFFWFRKHIRVFI